MKRLYSDTANPDDNQHLVGNALSVAVLSFLAATYAIFVLGAVLSFIPPSINSFVKDLFPLSLYDVRPEHESLLYRLWVVLAIAAAVAFNYLLRNKMAPGNLLPILRPWIITLLAIIALSCVFIFKWWLWQVPLARTAFYATVGAGGVVLLFVPEIAKWMPVVLKALAQQQEAVSRRLPWADTCIVAVVLGVLFIPLIKPCLSVILDADTFYHLDSMIMAPAWALVKGLKLNIDVGCEYSTMIPWVFVQLMQLLGGIDYARALEILVFCCGIYYLMSYVFLKRFISSRLLAFIVIIALMALQFFHWGVPPFMWQYPSATPLRYFFDMPLLLCMLGWVQKDDRRLLIIGGFFLAIALAWMIDTGLYLWGAWTACVLMYQLKSGWRWSICLGMIGLPLVAALGVTSMINPSLWGQGDYWHKSQEFISLFLRGWGALPVTDGFAQRQYAAVLCGILLPSFYVLALIISGARYLIAQGDRKDLLRVGLALYGLGLYHYYVHRSAVTSYVVVITPLVLLAADYLSAWLQRQRYFKAGMFKAILLGAAAVMLLTNLFFVLYPNVLNLSGKDWGAQVKTYERAIDFKGDAQLIARLTAPQERVALISSLETTLLMQADRAPFFYYFPLMESSYFSRPLNQSYLHTPKRTELVLGQLRQQQPRHIFIEARLWQAYQQGQLVATRGGVVPQTGLIALLEFIDKRYEQQEKGRYLLAFVLRP